LRRLPTLQPRDRCIDLKKVVVESFPLFSTPGQDEGGTFPIVTANNFIGKQLTNFSSPRSDGGDVVDHLIAFRTQIFHDVHADALGCIRGN
jgi:hypothetical protein